MLLTAKCPAGSGKMFMREHCVVRHVGVTGDQSQAAPRTPLKSPWAARTMGVSMPSEKV